MEQSPISTTPEPIPASPAANPTKKLLLIFAGCLVILLAFTAGFLLGKQVSQPKTPLPRGPEGTLRGTPTPPASNLTPAIDPTANWKTYTDSVYAFQFKYPKEWPIENHGIPDFPSDRVVIAGPFSNLIVSAQIPKLDNCLNQKKLHERDGNTPKNIVVGGITAWRVSLSGGRQEPSSEVVCLEKDNLTINIQFTLTKDIQVETFDQILSTFQFLD